ncbi:MAG: GNAT family N-acetyltransferase [Gemmataceae bacterium]
MLAFHTGASRATGASPKGEATGGAPGASLGLHGPPTAVAASDPSLRFELIADLDSLERLLPAWRTLHEQSDRAEPMQSPDWLLRWWRIYAPGSDRALRVAIWRLGERLVGLAPLCRRTCWYRGFLPFRRLEFLGSDVDENDGVCSEYLGLLAAPGLETGVASALVDQAARGGLGPWDEIVLSPFAGDDAQWGRLACHFRDRDFRVQEQETTTAPYVTLPRSWDDFLQGLSKSKRWNLKTQLKDFDAWAAGRTAWHEAATEEELERGRAILAALHEERWREDGRAGAFAAPRFAAFHDEHMRFLLKAGRLELLWLTVGGRPVAALYAFRAAGKVAFYQSGRATDLPEKVRVGSVIVAHAIRRAIERGDREFDFLGGPARYKLAFTTTTRRLFSLRIARPDMKEAVRRAAETVVAAARQLRACLRRA